MEKESYHPSEEEIRAAEEHLTEEQRRESDEREAAFERSAPDMLDPGRGTLKYLVDPKLLSLDKLDEIATANGFERKGEFHLTLFGFQEGKKVKQAIRKRIPAQERQGVIERVNRLLAEHRWSIQVSDPTIYRIQKDFVTVDNDGQETDREHRESYIQMVDLPGIEDLYRELNALLKTSLKPRPPHLTLYTNGSDPKRSKQGIGIRTQEALEEMHPTPVEY